MDEQKPETVNTETPTQSTKPDATGAETALETFTYRRSGYIYKIAFGE